MGLLGKSGQFKRQYEMYKQKEDSFENKVRFGNRHFDHPNKPQSQK